MICIRKASNCELSLIYLSDAIDRDAYVAEVERAYDSGDLAPGGVRCVVLGHDADISGLSVEDFQFIRKRIMALEGAEGTSREPIFFSVMVAPAEAQAVLSEIYMTLWAIDHKNPVEFHLARNIEQADALLRKNLHMPDPLCEILARIIPDPLRMEPSERASGF